MSTPQDPYSGPEWEAFVKHATEVTHPRMDASKFAISLFPEDGPDPKFALELGYMVMLDKPIIVVITPGQAIPDKVVRVADKIVEADMRTDTGRDSAQKRIVAAIDELTRERGIT